jgi:hypothetical protein
MAKRLAEKLVGSVLIDVGDGKKWSIVVTNRIIMEIEDAHPGMNLLSGEFANLYRPNVRSLATVLYEVLKRAGAPYSFGDIVDRVHPGNIVVLQTGILTAWGNSMPTKEQMAALDPTSAPAAPTG